MDAGRRKNQLRCSARTAKISHNIMHCTKVYLVLVAITVIGGGGGGGASARPAVINDAAPDVKSENSKLYVPTKWDRGMELFGQIMDAMRFGTGRLVNFVMMARNVIAERAEELKSEAANKVVAVIAARDARKIIHQKTAPEKRSVPVTKADVQQLMSEAGQGLFEAPKQKPIEEYLRSIINPTPVVDRITPAEKEKYGNAGTEQQFSSAGKAIVNNVENFSNFINALIDAPGKALKSASKSLTTALDRVGARLVGLQ